MRHAVHRATLHPFGVRYLTKSAHASPTFIRDRRLEHETLPEEQLRRDKHRTHRIRKHGNAELPLPPLLDPALHRTRMSYTRLEQRFQKDVPLTAFQKELASNAHAQALTGAIRRCKVTRAVLPVHFLQQFEPFIDADTARNRVQYRPVSHFGKRKPLPKIERAYALNKVSVLHELGKPKVQNILVSQVAGDQAARQLGLGAGSFDASKHVQWDKDMCQKVEAELWREVQELTKRLQSSSPALCQQDYDTSSSDAANIAAFIRVNAAATKHEVIQGKPCYVLARTALSKNIATDEAETQAAHQQQHLDAESEKLVGVVRHLKTTELLMALDRLFTHKDLYP